MRRDEWKSNGNVEAGKVELNAKQVHNTEHRKLRLSSQMPTSTRDDTDRA